MMAAPLAAGDGSGSSAADVAYGDVRERILSGRIEGGRMLSEGEVAARMGVSRTPVREAFLRLQAEGWLRLYPKRGALVLTPAPDERDDVLDARRLLEAHAVASLVDDPESRALLAVRLRDVLSRQASAAASGDRDGFLSADADFHAAIVDAGRNRLLAAFGGTLRDRQRRMTATAVRTPERMRRIVDEHAAIVIPIEQGDVAAFRLAFDEHLRRTHG